MNNLISAQDAINAMQVGKTVLCRSIGGLLDFDELSQFPATVFFTGDHEFCIKIDEITINGYTFLKPFSLDELSEGQDVFLLGNAGSILKGQFIPEYDELVSAVKNGSVQRDFENAQKQAKAIHSLLGINNDLILKVVDFQEFMKPVSKSKKVNRKKIEASEPTVEQEIVEDINSSKITIIEQGPIHVVEDSLVSDVAIENNESKDDEQYQNDLNDLVDRARKASIPVEANALVRYTRSWTEEQRKPLMQAIHARLVELDELNKTKNDEPPSLMVQIQNAVDLTELDALEIDVAGRHQDIQPKLMSYVIKRRKELESMS
ncbi:hypothetical protein B9T31_14785 [Acinetobacter sp. ANC 4558]|uniref:hypothetical protein n=1 Tax=Acinetobacter sp. ANC 4558 TaxID=1977876 RepID=UPI000A35865F|nr:hypothetical protein [Acinetobacter sp. ANC 4558]OTG82554.1 hypothetical protein B9T31_14785 [Acinetobacter sp. ANC 4558]